MSIEVARYDDCRKDEWNHFVKNAKNGHFMFDRDYMEYHSDRFSDYSLMFFDHKKRVQAVLPANVKDGVLYSHQGLTFGGLVVSKKASASLILDAFQALIDFAARSEFLTSVIYKRVPDFYTSYPAQEDLYALFRADAKLIRRDLSSVVDLNEGYSYSKGRKWSIKKAKKTEIVVGESYELSDFWSLLNHVLEKQHQTNPTHSVDEMRLLKSRFPDNIRCFTATMNSELLAGAIIYETDQVAHAQYLANSEKGKELGALDLVIDHLLTLVYKGKRFFDFGISTTDGGKSLNAGLIAQKEGFGARACVHDFYEIAVK